MRIYCSACGYPKTTCLCPYVITSDAPAKIVILQHHREVSHAKNTARLVSLGLRNTILVSGRTAEDFSQIASEIDLKTSALIYPGDKSRSIESAAFTAHVPRTLIFLDGSWRQAYALYSQLPWLSALPQWCFNHAPESDYTIRHTTQPNSLSTLEAVAYTLKTGYAFNTAPLLALQSALQNSWQGPAHHRR
ncbi:DTW domain-containing protein [Salinimonas sp. HHU 13199]|uniref:tRNA-uridine aminocarboxypropyltransferase n=1 Tax=Salinimonas profundi TaxID=2729140 RepID=A0ABR8LPB4_9ALTE|nr:tRNA-uridine aminocarboxypropyltransferase [Salinimonas profundi]MBD3585789.1 DTW domain-containing protein [Salinimonas profundi]